jgi:hypothetical protein
MFVVSGYTKVFVRTIGQLCTNLTKIANGRFLKSRVVLNGRGFITDEIFTWCQKRHEISQLGNWIDPKEFGVEMPK